MDKYIKDYCSTYGVHAIDDKIKYKVTSHLIDDKVKFTVKGERNVKVIKIR